MRSGARVDDMVNTCELLINVVNGNKPKVLTSPKRTNRLGPKGKWPGVRVSSSLTADDAPPANRRNPSASLRTGSNPFDGLSVERGKPVGLPLGKRAVR